MPALPEAVTVIVPFGVVQLVLFVATASDAMISSKTSKFTVAVAVQPLAKVAVTVYKVVCCGATFIVALVEPVFHS